MLAPVVILEFHFFMRCNCGFSGTFRVLVEIKRCIYEIHDILD